MNNKDENLRLEELRLKIENSYNKWYDENKDKLKAPALDLSFMNTHPEMAAAPDFPFKLRGRSIMKKKILAVSITLVVILSGVLIAGISDKGDLEKNEIQSLQNTVQGAFETEMLLASFKSPDGTTASLTEEELDELINTYSQKVDQYYSKSYFKQDTYSNMNEYYLRAYFKDHIGGCQNGGASDCVFNEIKTLSDHQVKVKGSIACWNQWIRQEENQDVFKIEYPIDRIEFEFIIEKEGDEWKLKEELKLNFEPIESVNQETLSSMEILSRVTEERNAVIENRYDNYESAAAALENLK